MGEGVKHRMSERGYRHLPVVDDGRVVGIVSIRDLYPAVNIELAEDLQQRDAFIFDTGYGTGRGRGLRQGPAGGGDGPAAVARG